MPSQLQHTLGAIQLPSTCFPAILHSLPPYQVLLSTMKLIRWHTKTVATKQQVVWHFLHQPEQCDVCALVVTSTCHMLLVCFVNQSILSIQSSTLPHTELTKSLTGWQVSYTTSNHWQQQDVEKFYRGLWHWLWHQLLSAAAGGDWQWLPATVAEAHQCSELETDACRWLETAAADLPVLHSSHLLIAQTHRHEHICISIHTFTVY